MGWVELGPAKKLDVFYSHVTGLFIKYFLTVIRIQTQSRTCKL